MPALSHTGNQIFAPTIKAKTVAYTVTTSESGVIFTDRGATVAVNFTLPVNSTVPIGFDVTFYGVSAYGFTVTCSPADTIVGLNNAAADTVTCTTTSLMIGAAVRLIWDGVSWLAFAASAGPTYTVAG
jgi:hypothetical protein